MKTLAHLEKELKEAKAELASAENAFWSWRGAISPVRADEAEARVRALEKEIEALRK